MVYALLFMLLLCAAQPVLPSHPMWITVLQVLFVLALVVILILFVFQPRHNHAFILPENFRNILNDYVQFYKRLDDEAKKRFEEKMQKFLQGVKITSANAEVEDLDLILIGAAAVIPVFYINDWEYINLREIVFYPGHFNTDFDQHGTDRTIAGMVGTGHMENTMILSKWELRQGFIHSAGKRNTAIHEFVHLVDKMDGTLDGIPEILLERKYVAEWQGLLQATMEDIRQGRSDIDPYGATSPVECFAVVTEYFFTWPEEFQLAHPVLATMLKKIFLRK